jgi:hypothetical protein
VVHERALRHVRPLGDASRGQSRVALVDEAAPRGVEDRGARRDPLLGPRLPARMNFVDHLIDMLPFAFADHLNGE